MSGPLPIQFDPASLILLNIIMAAMMFGVSLTLKLEDFKRIIKAPVAPLAGLFAQFLLLPLATCLLTWVLNIDPELALGMILVACCPGGSFSNVMTWLGKGNVAVSVSMTAVSSLVATVLTPVNFAFYGWLNPHTREYLTQISLEPGSILLIVLLVLALPLVLGMLSGKRWPALALRSEKPLHRTLQQLLLAGGSAQPAGAVIGLRHGAADEAAGRRPPRSDHGSGHSELGIGAGDPLYLLPECRRHDADYRVLGHLASGLRADPVADLGLSEPPRRPSTTACRPARRRTESVSYEQTHSDYRRRRLYRPPVG